MTISISNSRTKLALAAMTAVLLALGIGGSAWAQPPQLVGRWPMEEGSGSLIQDASGNANHGNITGTPSWVTGVDGLALSLSGTGQYALVPDNATLDITTGFTLATWIRPTKAAAATQYLIKKSTTGPPANGYELSLGASGKPFVRFNELTNGNLYRVNGLTSYPLNNTAWMHLAATYDGTTLKLYVNGVLDSSKVFTATVLTNNLALGIGAQSNGGSPFQGPMDEAQVYNYALSSSEVADLAATHTLTVNAANGIVAISPSQSSYVHGKAVLLTAAPNVGYHFVDWTGDITASTDTTTIIMSADKTVTANFAQNTYTLTYTAGVGGTISGTNPQTVAHGTDGSLVTATPNVGYHFVSWSDAYPTAARTDVNVTTDLSVTATFALNTYTLSYAAGANGSIVGTNPQTVAHGEDGTLVTATPDAGYHFVSWSDAYPTAARTDLDVTADLSVTADFAIDAPTNTSTVNVGAAPGLITLGNPVRTVPVTISRTDLTPLMAFSVTFSVSSSLTVNGGLAGIDEGTYLSAANPTTSFNLIDQGTDGLGNHSYQADGTTLGAPCGSSAASGTLFTIELSSAASSGSGTVTITTLKLRDCSNVDLPQVIGTSSTVSIDQSAPSVHVTAPDGGETWRVGSSQSVTWTGSDPEGIASYDLAYSTDGGTSYPNAIATVPGTEMSYAWTIPAAPGTTVRVRVTAHDANGNPGVDASDADFTIAYYTLTYIAGSNGSIVGTNPQTVAHGADGTQVTATPAAGYHFLSWSDAYPTAARTDLNVTADISVTATFALNTYTLDVTTVGSGSVAKDPDQASYDHGTSVSLTATPAVGWHFVGWSGALSGSTNPQSLLMDGNKAVTATFAINTYTLDVTTVGSGSVAKDPDQASYDHGTSVSLTATPAVGWHFVGWSGALSGSTNPQSLLMDGNKAVTATFALNTYTLDVTTVGSGSVAKDPDQASYDHGTSVSLTATPAVGWHFVGWSGALSGSTNPQSLLMDGNKAVTATFEANPPVAAVANLVATQVTPGTLDDQTTPIQVTWDATPPGTTVEVWRQGFGSYPEYDDASGATPTVSPAYPPGAGWVKVVGLTTPGGSDLPPTRDFYYYVAYAQDGFGTWSPTSTMTSGTLDYHLGDVTNGIAAGTGNNKVYSEDISLLGAFYGLTNGAVTPVNFLDVGPTTNLFVDGRPTTDNRIDFEDLVMFAINYGLGHVGPGALAALPVAGTVTADEIVLEAPNRGTPGQAVTARLTMRGTGAVIAVSARLAWDPAVVEPVSHTAGDWLAQQGGQAFSAKPGTVDAALMRAQGMKGEGVLAAVTFRVLSTGDPKIRIEALDGRDARNRPVDVAKSLQPQAPVIPLTTQLSFARPNPFRQTVTIPFSLSARASVALVVYSVDGRRVRTLVSETRDAGEYNEVWDGRDDNGNAAVAGVYYARLITPQGRFTRTITNLK